MPLSQRQGRLVRSLRSPKSRVRERRVLVEGVRAVGEALDAGVTVTFAVTSSRLEGTKAGTRLAARLEPYERVALSDRELSGVADAGTHQGVLLVCAEPESSLEAVRRGGRYLVLDQVQDPGNSGALARAAVAFGLAAVLSLDGSVDPWSAKAVRASAGMSFRIPIVRAEAEAAVDRMEAEGVPLFVADPRGEDVEARRGAPSFALVVGNEGAGVRAALRRRASRAVAVPMPGPAESLNVAVAGSILLYVLSGEGRRA